MGGDPFTLLFFNLVLTAIGLVILYCVIRFAVRHGIEDADRRYTYVECRVQSTIVNGPDGRPTQLTFGDDGYIDYFGRPWAENWEKHFEQGWADEPAAR